MTDEMRKRIIEFNRHQADRSAKAEDQAALIRHLAPIIGTLWGFLPGAVRKILEKYL